LILSPQDQRVKHFSASQWERFVTSRCAVAKRATDLLKERNDEQARNLLYHLILIYLASDAAHRAEDVYSTTKHQLYTLKAKQQNDTLKSKQQK
jgi:hypothetical protein